ncbi:MAG TPA: 7-carboxy-7-deazaguanine synthase QueE [Candidatus Binatia bacterium]
MLLSRLASGEPELFASVQGEGITCGLPSVFVRLSLCNLSCGFCDTKYTWDWAHFDRAAETISLPTDDVARRVLALAAGGPRNVVLTGGEPLLQQRELADLAGRLRGAGLRIEVETNATIVPADALAGSVDQWNVSPKLATSGNAPEARQQPEALAWFAAWPDAHFKFVVVEPADVDEVAALTVSYRIPAERVTLMPEGTDAATLAARSRWLAERCQALGFRLGTRLHVLLWGAARGS